MGIILYRIEKLFNSAEINIKRGKCWYRKGQFHYFSKQRTWGDLLNIKSMSASCFLIHNIPLNSMAHKQWSWSLHSYEKTYSSLVTNSAPLHILLYSSGHLNINDNCFCFKISMDPTAMILIRVEKFEGWGRVHKFRIRYPKFSIHPFHSFFSPSMRHSQYSGSFRFLIFLASLNLFIVKVSNLGNQETTNSYVGKL